VCGAVGAACIDMSMDSGMHMFVHMCAPTPLATTRTNTSTTTCHPTDQIQTNTYSITPHHHHHHHHQHQNSAGTKERPCHPSTQPTNKHQSPHQPNTTTIITTNTKTALGPKDTAPSDVYEVTWAEYEAPVKKEKKQTAMAGAGGGGGES
jgi:hypothetical protein